MLTRVVWPGTNAAPAYMAPSLQEWLETDGLGGFASSTTAAIHTRRYHGWLFLAGDEPGDRWLALSKLDDACRTPQGDWDLSTSFFPGVTHPAGVRHLWRFWRDPFPAFVYKLGDLFLTREIFMARGLPGVFCRYSLEAPPGSQSPTGVAVTLTARPLCNHRSYHHCARAMSWDPRVFAVQSGVVVSSGSSRGDILLAFHGAVFQEDPRWYYNMLYPKEHDRGLDYSEDHFSPGAFTATVTTQSPGCFWAGPVPEGRAVEDFARDLAVYLEECRLREAGRRKAVLLSGGVDRPDSAGRRGDDGPREAGWLSGARQLSRRLALAGDQFIVRSRQGASIIAGYHWFGEWGRDSFISLPGLLLTSRRFDEAREVFSRFGGALREGLVPNRFEEGSGAAHNSVDASLWMIHALREYEKASGDTAFVLSMLPSVERIVEAYASGTLYGIHVGWRGLLHAGGDGTQVTWMDASREGAPVTPREGYPVEVNALWVVALRCLARWTRMAGKAGGFRYEEISRSTLQQFIRAFAWPGTGLYDAQRPEGPVLEIRANQVIAAGLEGFRLPWSIRRDVWTTAVQKLLTPRGLRTLDPSSEAYRGRYGGDPNARDAAYHQGSAWPWLAGSLYNLAGKLDLGRSHRTTGPYARWVLRHAMPGIVDLDRNPCVGSIFEVASGDWPFEPGGAVAQSWSVAEAQRVIKRALTGHYLTCGRGMARKRVGP